MKFRMTALAALTALAMLLPAAAVRADNGVPGNVVVARASGDALVIWDASPEVGELVSSRTPDDRAAARLQRDALRVAADSLSKIEGGASSLTVRIIYSKSGAVSPVYGAATFAGVERYATVQLPFKDAQADRDHWKTLDAKAPLPKWIEVKVTGQLPPHQ